MAKCFVIHGVAVSQSASSYVSRNVDSSRLFFLDVEGREDFAVVFGGFERCASDYRIDRHDFPWYSLEFVGQGEGILWLDGTKEPLHPGSFYLYGPSQAHRIESSPGNPLRKYFVGFTGAGVEAFLESFGMRPGFISRCHKGEPIRRTFDILIDRGVRKSGLAKPLCAAITRQLLLMCRDDATDAGPADGPAFDSYSRARDFIEREFLSVKTLDAISQACGIDAPYLCRLFARYHDESPYQFLTRLRMEHASRLVLQEGGSVKSVAAALGFKDAFHFSRVFKSVHHVPPSRFRQAMHPKGSRESRLTREPETG